jgi:hypothetical protein
MKIEPLSVFYTLDERVNTLVPGEVIKFSECAMNQIFQLANLQLKSTLLTLFFLLMYEPISSPHNHNILCCCPYFHSIVWEDMWL